MVSTSRAIATIILVWLICGDAFCQGALLDSNYSGFGMDVGYSRAGDDELTSIALGYSAGGDVDVGLIIGGTNRSTGQSYTPYSNLPGTRRSIAKSNAVYGAYANAYVLKQGRDKTPISIVVQGTFLRQHDGAGGSSFGVSLFPTFRIGSFGLQPRVGVGLASGDADRPTDRIAGSGGLAIFANFNNKAIFFVSSSISTRAREEVFSVSSGLVFPFGKKPRTEDTGRKRQPSMCVVPLQSGRSL